MEEHADGYPRYQLPCLGQLKLRHCYAAFGMACMSTGTRPNSKEYAGASKGGAGRLPLDITGDLLKTLFHELNKLYFEGTLTCEVLWGPRSMIRSGCTHSVSQCTWLCIAWALPTNNIFSALLAAPVGLLLQVRRADICEGRAHDHSPVTCAAAPGVTSCILELSQFRYPLPVNRTAMRTHSCLTLRSR